MAGLGIVDTAPMRVVIAEDQALMRAAVRGVLERDGFEIVGEAEDRDGLVRKVLAHRPDVVVTDIRMPPGHADEGLAAAIALRHEIPELPIVVLSHHLRVKRAIELFGGDHGAASGLGYLLKQRVAASESFCADVRRVADGGVAIDPDVVAEMINRSRRDPLAALPPHRREILRLMAEGRSNAAIAAELVVTEKAVSKQVSLIYSELGLAPGGDGDRRVEAVIRYLDS